MKSRMSLVRLAKEEETDGVTRTETEYVYYGMIQNPAILDTASHVEDQVQWEIKIAKTNDNFSSGRQRVRMTYPPGSPHLAKFELTTKVKVEQKDPESNNAPNEEKENTVEASQQLFAIYEMMAGCGMHKRRYTIPIEGHPGLNWQIDRFFIKGGEELSAWCKIDIEVSQPVQLPKQIPGFIHLITNQKGFQSTEEQKLIQRLYNEIFLMKNKYVEGDLA